MVHSSEMPIRVGHDKTPSNTPLREVYDANPERLADGHAWGRFRDPVVARGIENVTGRHQAEDFWALSPFEGTEGIYDEVKRLDLAEVRGIMETVADSLRPKGTHRVSFRPL
jgi:hypothetical protein